MGAVEDAFAERAAAGQPGTDAEANKRRIITGIYERLPETLQALASNDFPQFAGKRWAARLVKCGGREIIAWYFSYDIPAPTTPVRRSRVAVPQQAVGLHVSGPKESLVGKFIFSKDASKGEFEYAVLEKLTPVVLAGLYGLLGALRNPEKSPVWDIPDLPSSNV